MIRNTRIETLKKFSSNVFIPQSKTYTDFDIILTLNQDSLEIKVFEKTTTKKLELSYSINILDAVDWTLQTFVTYLVEVIRPNWNKFINESRNQGNGEFVKTILMTNSTDEYNDWINAIHIKETKNFRISTLLDNFPYIPNITKSYKIDLLRYTAPNTYYEIYRLGFIDTDNTKNNISYWVDFSLEKYLMDMDSNINELNGFLLYMFNDRTLTEKIKERYQNLNTGVNITK